MPASHPLPQAPLYAVGTAKFIVLNLTTVNLFMLYWGYQNWRRVQFERPGRVSPAARSLFFAFTLHGLLSRMKDKAARLGHPLHFPSLAIALGVLIGASIAYLPAPASLLTFATPLILVQVDRQALRVNQATAPAAPLHTRWTSINIAWLVAIALLVGLAVLGNMMGRDA